MKLAFSRPLNRFNINYDQILRGLLIINYIKLTNNFSGLILPYYIHNRINNKPLILKIYFILQRILTF